MSSSQEKLNIEEIDKNFAIPTKLGREDVRFFNIQSRPEMLYGILFDEAGFFRMPCELAASISKSTAALNRQSSGGRIRFRTNSPFVAISVKLPYDEIMWHMPVSGSSGFDLYVDNRFLGMFRPSATSKHISYDRLLELPKSEDGWHEILIHFPLYDTVDSVHIGVQEEAEITAPTPYAVERPVVFYGSSITQGGCVSRPGISYPAHISRWLDCHYINLGFSGNAKGEPAMADYIASLDPSVFVMDYDHNAPSYEHLEATHYAFYERFRALRPDTPIVMVSAPDVRWNEMLLARRDLIRRSYEMAVAAGDERVFFVDGERLMDGDDWDSYTVDGIHPNDLGHYRMAKGIAPAVEQALRLIRA